MSYTFRFSDDFREDVTFHKKTGNKSVVSKIEKLIKEIGVTPFTGTGKPEQLKYDLSGKWSRRINKEHRLVYKVKDKIITILSAKGHYD